MIYTNLYWLLILANVFKLELFEAIKLFPYNSIYNGTDISYYVKSETDIQKFLCSNRYETDPCCKCDDDCFKYDSCCIDKLWYNLGSKAEVSSYIDLLIKYSEENVYKNIECEYIFPSAMDAGHSSLSYFMVKSCLPEADINDINACLSDDAKKFSAKIPVFGADFQIYKNKFCASCNFVSSFQAINLKADCAKLETSSEFITFMDMSDCLFYIDLESYKNASNRQCVKQEICQENHKYYNICKSYTGYFFGYKNYHCWKCSNTVQQDIVCPSDPNIIRQDLRWSLLLQVSAQSQTVVSVFESNNRPVSNYKCRLGTLPDLIRGGCVPYLCPQNYQLVELNCVNLMPEMIRLKRSDYYNCLTAQTPYVFIIHDYLDSTNLVATVGSILNIPVDAFSYYARNTNFTITKIKPKYTNVFIKEIEAPSLKFSEILKKVSSLIISSVEPMITHAFPTNFHYSFPGNRMCAESETLDLRSVNFSLSCGVHFNSSFIDPSKNLFYMLISKFNTTRHLSYCKEYYLKSDCLLHNITEGVTINENKSLIYRSKNGKNIVYHTHEYIPLRIGYGVCIQKEEMVFTNLEWLYFIQRLEGGVSLVATAVSSGCYIVTLITFGLLNFPGYGLLSLCLCLFFSDFLFLVASTISATGIFVYPVLCEGIAILMQFGLLSVQVCAAIASVDIVLGFREVRVHYKIKAHDYFKYRVFFIAIPLLITIFSLILDQQGIVDMAYGNNGLCVFQGFYGRLIFYIIPTVISLSCSVSLSAYTIYKVTAQNRDGCNSFNDSEVRSINPAVIALKLIFTYGIIEVVGFIQIPDKHLSQNEKIFNIIFSFSYTLLRGFRGVIIFIIYVCRKTVIDHYKRCLCTQKAKRITSKSMPDVKTSAVMHRVHKNDENTCQQMTPKRGFELDEDIKKKGFLIRFIQSLRQHLSRFNATNIIVKEDRNDTDVISSIENEVENKDHRISDERPFTENDADKMKEDIQRESQTDKSKRFSKKGRNYNRAIYYHEKQSQMGFVFDNNTLDTSETIRSRSESSYKKE